MALTEPQLVKVFERLRLANVDITPSPDMSTIAAIRANWRWPVECPDDATLEAVWEQIQADDAKVAYRDARKTGTPCYASVEDQLDMLYWDSVNGTSTWSDHIAAVKAAHPKPV